jgi:uncharacterized protein
MYMNDLTTDLKHSLEELCPGFKKAFNTLTDLADELVCEKFGITYPMRGDPEIKHADLMALATEKRDIMLPPPLPWIDLPQPAPDVIQPMTEDEARDAFLDRFAALTR